MQRIFTAESGITSDAAPPIRPAPQRVYLMVLLATFDSVLSAPVVLNAFTPK